jgi:hypothetical protein
MESLLQYSYDDSDSEPELEPELQPEPDLDFEYSPPRLPYELLDRIIQQTDDTSTLAMMMRVSHRFNHIAGPRLYGHVDLTAKNAKQLFAIPKRPEIVGDSENNKKRKRDTSNGSAVNTDGAFSGKAELEERGSSVASSSSTSIPALNAIYSPTTAPLKTKSQLLSMIKQLNVHTIPTTKVCTWLALLAKSKKIPLLVEPMLISIRPRAVWKLIGYYSLNPNPLVQRPLHPFLYFLRSLDCSHLCVQLPIVDQHLEESTRERHPHLSGFSDACLQRKMKSIFCDQTTENAYSHIHSLVGRFYDLYIPVSESITIHNLVLSMRERALATIDPGVNTVRAFFRPCKGADGELDKEAQDRNCWNHSKGFTDGTLKLHDRILSSTANIEFIDIDWTRAKYEMGRDDGVLKCIEGGVEEQIRQFPEADRSTWGERTFRMANEVEPCQCCQKSQLSVVEVGRLRA